ncbi:Cupredoxin [Ephemerocybe angulata]|uniref:Cupredoxin n=1 Tax=Ephemerocybe angulata TaxID=980116 RepID=A0A8H6HZ81_9AGAR|nr:Cupredoxin [Tulosesus angulatus]
MRFSTSIVAAFLMTGVSTVLGATFTVTVGNNASLLYEPSSVTAKAGDVIEFEFTSKNHTVTQSTFDKPCVAKADGVNSGFQLVPAGTTIFPKWSITVQNDTAPLWFFCAQAPHCSKGMVFAINPTAEKTFDMFHTTALASAPAAALPLAPRTEALLAHLAPRPPRAQPTATTSAAAGTTPAANAGASTAESQVEAREATAL